MASSMSQMDVPKEENIASANSSMFLSFNVLCNVPITPPIHHIHALSLYRNYTPYTRYTRCIATYTPPTHGDAPSVYYTPIHYTLYTPIHYTPIQPSLCSTGGLRSILGARAGGRFSRRSRSSPVPAPDSSRGRSLDRLSAARGVQITCLEGVQGQIEKSYLIA